MEFSIVVALVAGLAATAVMSGADDAGHPPAHVHCIVDGPVRTTGGTVLLAAPGVLGSRWGGMTPVGLLMGHVAYGIVAALVYQALV